MRLIVSVGSMVVLLLLIAGCGGSPETLQATKTGDIPDWYPNAPQEGAVCAGRQYCRLAGPSVAVDKATTGARAELGVSWIPK